MNEQEIKTSIQAALQRFGHSPIDEAALALFETLGYRSDRRIKLTSLSDFRKTFDQQNKLNAKQALFDEWQSVAFLFQITGEEIAEQMSGPSLFKTAPSLKSEPATRKINQRESQSYLFFAVTLKKPEYSRTDLSSITRAVNRAFDMPALILFRHGAFLTFSIINRRLHKRDETKDVLEKVTLIKDIAFASPHRAHIEILYDLSLQALRQKQGFTNFIELHEAWRKTLDTSELNKRFFQDVANWYFWAIQHVKFPKDAHPDKEIRNATGVIRLITRLIFCWFVKEKGLIPGDLFNQHKIRQWLADRHPQQSAYYKAILQNLFFATLSQEMGKREFRRDGQNMMAHTLYRHKALFKNPAQAIKLFETIPFLNGGLFECLDRLEGTK